MTTDGTPAALLGLADERFVSLTTFRRSGEAVSTPVWIAADGDHLVVYTPAASGKVKRLRHTARVELRPCDRRGRVADGAPTVAGAATIHDDAEAVERVRVLMVGKYRLEFRIFMAVEAVVRRTRETPRVALHVSSVG